MTTAAMADATITAGEVTMTVVAVITMAEAATAKSS
jgi:hypothetical protein